MVDVPFHPQEEHHCGPAALLTVLEASGAEPAYTAVVERVYVPGLEGSLQAEMSATARHFGRVAYGPPPDPAAVFGEVAAGRPVLVLLNLGLPARPFWHYAVVVGFDPARNQILMRSGQDERLRVNARKWLRQWDWAGRWALVTLRPGEWPARPDRRRLLQALADFETAGDPAAARRAWRTASDHWPRELAVWLGLGNAAHALSDHPAAEAAYRRALALDADYWPARLNLASTLLDAGRACDGLELVGGGPGSFDRLHAVYLDLAISLREACPPD